MTDYRYLDEQDQELGWPGIYVLALVVSVAVWVSFCVAAAYL